MTTAVLKNMMRYVVLKFDEAVDADWVWVGTYASSDEAYRQEQDLRAAGAQATIVPKNIRLFDGTITQQRHVNASDWSKYDGNRVQSGR